MSIFEDQFKTPIVEMDITKFVDGVIRNVNETNEEFIFTVLETYCRSVTTIEISKKELFDAIALVRLQREAAEKYGSFISSDLRAATVQSSALEEAYNRGYEAGKKETTDKVLKYLGGESR